MTAQPKSAIPDSKNNLSRFQWRMVITAGMGFFTDAYDLFVIGIVTAILAPLWHISTAEIALLNSAALISAACGAVTFGLISDKFGRKKMYGIEIMILFIGSILSAVAPSFTWLLLSRILVGFGIGGDYPASGVVMSEYSNQNNRGFLVLLVFAMQAIGLIVGPLVAALLLSLQVSPDLTWRLLLGLGAIPAISVFYLRRRIAETPRFLLTKKMPFEVSRVVSELTGYAKNEPAPQFKPQKLLSKKWLKCLLGTAGAWFLLDVAFYGNGVSTVFIMNALNPSSSLLIHTLLSALMFLIFAVPGYVCATKYVDRLGRKNLQIFGFLMMGICYLFIAWLPDIQSNLFCFILLFGLSFFFVNFGPNATTFLIPSEIYPTNIRAQAHGISAAVGKIGAAFGAFILPMALDFNGMAFTMGLVGLVALAGIFTSFLVPEMKGVALEDAELFHDEPQQESGAEERTEARIN